MAFSIVVVRSDFRTFIANTVIFVLFFRTSVTLFITVMVELSSSAFSANSISVIILSSFRTFVAATIIVEPLLLSARLAFVVDEVRSSFRALVAAIVLEPFVGGVFRADVAFTFIKILTIFRADMALAFVVVFFVFGTSVTAVFFLIEVWIVCRTGTVSDSRVPVSGLSTVRTVSVGVQEVGSVADAALSGFIPFKFRGADT